MAEREPGSAVPGRRGQARAASTPSSPGARGHVPGRPGRPGLPPGHRHRPPGLFLAGAWTDTGWPATMEGAVRSGHAAARAVLAHRRPDATIRRCWRDRRRRPRCSTGPRHSSSPRSATAVDAPAPRASAGPPSTTSGWVDLDGRPPTAAAARACGPRWPLLSAAAVGADRGRRRAGRRRHRAGAQLLAAARRRHRRRPANAATGPRCGPLFGVGARPSLVGDALTPWPSRCCSRLARRGRAERLGAGRAATGR